MNSTYKNNVAYALYKLYSVEISEKKMWHTLS
ncbi:hypothetical protein BH23THE1_BH23THE1_28740 [soil metagenome]